MTALFKMKKSRDSWKDKAIQRGEAQRSLRKEIGRAKEKIESQNVKIRALRAETEALLAQKSAGVTCKAELIFISLFIFLFGRISFRGVSRVLSILNQYLGIKAPCPQTVINWIIKLSLSRMKYVHELSSTSPRLLADPFSNGYIWMIDTSIALSAGKILAVLALDVNHFKERGHAPTLQNVHCVGVSVASSWNGDSIATFLKKIIAVLGRPLAILKDGGTDLAKATSVLLEDGMPIKCIADVSHVVANILRHKYEKCPRFKLFLSVCGEASKMLKQTLLACLAPPKVSTKARFMNVHKLVSWAQKILNHSTAGRAPVGSVLAKLRLAIGKLPWCKNIIKSFLADAMPLLECQKIIKTAGLSTKTQQECLKILEAQPHYSSVFKDFSQWMAEQLMVAEELGLENVGLPISSDTIESLFGVAKHHGVGAIKDPNRIALHIPALCGSLTPQDAHRAMNISMSEVDDITETLTSLTKQRREILPNPGTIEKLAEKTVVNNLELLPRSKSWEKTAENPLPHCLQAKTTGPNFSGDFKLLEMGLITPTCVASAA